MKPLSQTRAKIIEEFTERNASGEGRIRFYNQIEEMKWLENALNDYTQSIVEMVEEELKGMQYNHEYCDDCHYHEALDDLQTYLNDIKEELNG